MMSGVSPPAMSVILVTPDRYQTIARTVSALRAQATANRLELVIVAPDRRALEMPDADRQAFASVSVVAIGDVRRLAVAHAAGVNAATASVVAFAEDHAFPAPGWAEALVAAHSGPWTGVGPAMRNANPESLTSWADFLLGYGRWRVPIRSGAVDHLPGHNSSYKRAALLAFREELAERLQAPALLHDDLVRRGHRLYLEATASVSHVNFATWSVWVRLRFHAGRAFAAARARNWSVGRRMMFVLAAPAVPFVRLARIAGESRRADQPPGFLLNIAPVLWVGLVFDALGEVIGYVAGAGHTHDREWEWEFHRERHV